jgi:hypothetical protein
MAKHNPITGVRMRENSRPTAYEAPQGNMGQHGADRATHDDEHAQQHLRNVEHEFHGGAMETSGYGEPPSSHHFGDLAGQGVIGVEGAGNQEVRPLGDGNSGPAQVHSPKAEAHGRRHHADKGGIDYHRERPVEPERPQADKTVRRANTADKSSRKRMR